MSERILNPAVLVLCGVILAARKPDMIFRPQFWAEDGGLFFLQAYQHGLNSLWLAYGGYLHLAPRLIAWFADSFDPVLAPAIYVAFAGCLTLWVAARTLSERFPLRPRIGCALAVVLVPDAFEVVLNVTNLQWLLAAGLVALLVSDDPRTKGQRIHDSATAVLAGLTGPFSTLLAPLFLARAARRRSLWSVIIALLVTGAGVVQLACVIQHPTPVPPNETVEWVFFGPAAGVRTAGSILLGHWVPSPPSVAVGWALAVLTASAVIYLAARPGAAWFERICLGLAIVGFLGASLYRCRFVLPELCQAGFGARYFYPIQMLVLWLVISQLAEANQGRKITAAATLVLIFAVNLPRLREPALENMHWEDYAPQIRSGEPVVVPINPRGWTIPLPGRR